MCVCVLGVESEKAANDSPGSLFSSSSSPYSPTALSHSLPNGYLPCWKGLDFLSGEAVGEAKGAGPTWTDGRYIIGVGLRGDANSPPRSGSEGSEGRKELHVNICSQRPPGLKQIRYILPALFPSPKPIQERCRWLASRGLGRGCGGVDTEGKVFGAEVASG